MRSSDDQSMELQPGTIVTGRYEIVKRLGRGSMGFVYACRDREHAGRLVAMKVLFQDFAKDKTGAARFRNEILAAFEVHHDNVMSAFEYIRDGGITAYTMEYVGGGDLAERISKGEQLPMHEVLRLWSQMAAGVEAIHKKGIIHRDLKPENILLTTTGDVKIADFGIARMGHGPKLTEHGGVVGTIDYVSPEYMIRGQVDHRSDIYALGILSYEMLTGASPFQGDSVYAAMTKRLKQDPTPPSTLRGDCPVSVDQIVLKAMEREPEARYQSAAQMQIDIDTLRETLGFIDIPSSLSARTDTVSGLMPTTRSGRVVRVGLDEDSGTTGISNDEYGANSAVVGENNPLGRYFDEEQDEQQGESLAALEQMEPLLNRANVKGSSSDWTRPRGAVATTAIASGRQSGSSTSVASLSRVSNVRTESSGEVAGGLHSGGMASHKLRTLAPLPTPSERSWLNDIVLALIMLFVGVGFGFAVISVVLPNFFDRESAGETATVNRQDNF